MSSSLIIYHVLHGLTLLSVVYFKPPNSCYRYRTETNKERTTAITAAADNDDNNNWSTHAYTIVPAPIFICLPKTDYNIQLHGKTIDYF